MDKPEGRKEGTLGADMKSKEKLLDGLGWNEDERKTLDMAAAAAAMGRDRDGTGTI